MQPPRRSRAQVVALALACALGGCDDETPPAPDATPDSGGVTPCGVGAATVELGVGFPFEPVPDLRFAIDQGRQGGHHFDISVRSQGALDPDHADVELVLRDGDTQLARHFTADWLLHIGADGEGCDYPQARLVLVDAEGGLLTASAAQALVGRPLDLEVHLRTPRGDADGRFTITPTEVRSLR